MMNREQKSPLASKLVNSLLGLTLLYAGCFATLYELPLQSPVLIAFGLMGVWVAAFWQRGGGNTISWLSWLTLFSMSFFAARAALSPVVDFGREDLFLIVSAGLFYVLAGNILAFPKVRVFLAIVVIVVLGLHLVSALMQLGGGDGYWPAGWFSGAERASSDVVTGMYGYRGSFANYAAIGSGLCLALAVWGKMAIWLRCLLSLVALVSSGMVVLSESRSAALSLMVGLVLFIVLFWVSISHLPDNIKSRIKIGLVVCGLLGVVLFGLAAYQVLQKRSHAEGADVLFTDGARTGYWPMALEQFADRPVLGAGSRSFSYENYRHWNPNMWVNSPDPEFVHNEYLQLLVDYGLVGLLLVLLILGGHFVLGVKRIMKLRRQEGLNIGGGSNSMALAIAGVVGIVTMAVHVIFDFRTHLLANLLLLVMCLVWVLPASGKAASNAAPGLPQVSGWFVRLFVALFGLLAIWMGAVEFRGGVPLLQNRMGMETGTWYPEAVQRDVVMPVLENSADRAPSYRRYLKLGTLYRLEAGAKEGEREKWLERSRNSFLKAEFRHPYHPVVLINLASVSTDLGQYDDAERYFAKAYELSGERGDRLFGIHWKWAGMLHKKAQESWKVGEMEVARRTYAEAEKVMYLASFRGSAWRESYVNLLSEYWIFLSRTKDYSEAKRSIDLARLKNSEREFKRLYLALGRYHHAKGVQLWYERRPAEAMGTLHTSWNYYQRYLRRAHGAAREEAAKGLRDVEKIINFLKATGIKSHNSL